MIGEVVLAIGIVCGLYCVLVILDKVPERLIPSRPWQMGAIIFLSMCLIMIGEALR